MEIIKIIGVGIATTIAYLVVKQVKNDFAIFILLAGSILILVMIVGEVTNVVSYFDDIIERTGIDKTIYFTILKILGVGYLTEFAANMCSDASASSIGNKIILGGKIAILCLALPIITSLIEIVASVLP